MSVECVFESMSPQPTASIRTRSSVVNLPQVLGAGYGTIMEQLTSQGCFPAGAPFVAYYNMDMEDLDIELGFAVSQPIRASGSVHPGSFPDCRTATCIFTGPYTDMGPAYEAINQFMGKNGVTSTGVVYEFYLNDPQDTPPDQLQTKIVFPLKG